VTDGLILLGLLAVIFAIAVTRGRRRLGMAVTGRIFAIAACGFAIAVLILWVTQRK
jgi:1,4-dihydroxy-2-naphthoate octaprenyltransferase